MTPYLTDKDQRVLLVPMEFERGRQIIVAHIDKMNVVVYEPEQCVEWAPCMPLPDTGSIKYIEAPVRVGDKVPVREEWYHAKDGVTQYILYKSDHPRLTNDPMYDWQSAETMPDFAVRYWRRATKVDGGELVEGEPGHEFREWLWQIHVEPEEGE